MTDVDNFVRMATRFGGLEFNFTIYGEFHMLWTDCLTRLRQELSGNVFTMWIRPLVAEDINDHLLLQQLHQVQTTLPIKHFESLARHALATQQHLHL